jgi:enamine deaminase RidA (YjgF/YER057c/UK114 family)
MQRRDINASDAPPPVGSYTHVIEVAGAARTVYISGQVGVDRQGNVPADIAGQCRNVWSNLQAQLRAVDMTLDNIVKITTILVDRADLAETRRVREEVLGSRKPASTLIIAGLVSPQYKVEIEAIACA